MPNPCLRLALVTVCALSPALSPTAAFAEESDWSGMYLGLGASYLDLETTQYSLAQGAAPFYLSGIYGGGHRHGFIQTELRQQSGARVLGLRLRHQKTGSAGDSYLQTDETLSTKMTSVTSLSATIGYAVQPKLMVYANAGATYGRFDYCSVDFEWDQVDFSEKANRVGVTLGLGAEYRLTERLSAFTEVNMTRFVTGSATFHYPPPSETTQWTYDFDHDYSEIAMGMNIRF
ncbi:outer membrane beta-barrel protein [Xinfangfangia sp. CPCC 101601]|uniref:Outer membrane beta-barrel protein n=1 Tax=Pseudogemmobacter lacusdianii TaxID=3069608 RepID=A0ABU0VVN1_9RHOB|nr:outer membrane beta-barrel protein [Xinfangfangia sp. CPCC 101601]MDQ2065774.1 outer membrane beta-barrel protein [Xinfangfangia sp. CPCC 101601]